MHQKNLYTPINRFISNTAPCLVKQTFLYQFLQRCLYHNPNEKVDVQETNLTTITFGHQRNRLIKSAPNYKFLAAYFYFHLLSF